MKRIMFFSLASIMTIMLANSPIYGMMKKIRKATTGRAEKVLGHYLENVRETQEVVGQHFENVRQAQETIEKYAEHSELIEKAVKNYAENEMTMQVFKKLVGIESEQDFSMPRPADVLLEKYLSSLSEDEANQKLLYMCRLIEVNKSRDEAYGVLNKLGIPHSVRKQVNKRTEAIINESTDFLTPVVLNITFSAILLKLMWRDVSEWRAGQGYVFTLPIFFLELGVVGFLIGKTINKGLSILYNSSMLDDMTERLNRCQRSDKDDDYRGNEQND